MVPIGHAIHREVEQSQPYIEKRHVLSWVCLSSLYTVYWIIGNWPIGATPDNRQTDGQTDAGCRVM